MIRIDTVIVGAGFAGIGLGVRLKRQGRESFVILERANDVGGTWRDNIYPGVACDIPSQLYSFSFRQSPEWTRHFAPGPEIHGYLRETVRAEGLQGHVRLGAEMLESEWSEKDREWRVTTDAGEYRARSLVLACGRLTDPRLPSVPGIESFGGPWFHSARWRPDVRLEGRRVGVVGSGASAVQIMPHVAAVAAEAVLLQRSAPYVVPRQDRPVDEATRESYRRRPGAMVETRDELFWKQEQIFTQRVAGSATREDAKRAALGHLRAQVPDEALRAKLTPDYEYGCKRVLLSDDYYAALARPNVRVIPSALAAVDRAAAQTVDGERVELDVLIYATGFHTITQGYAERVRGRGGLALAEHWRDGMRAFASTLVAGFPNLFVFNGPNAGLGHNSAIHMIEAQIDLFMRWVREGAHEIEPSGAMEAAYVAQIEDMGRDTVWMTGGCSNWYVDRRAGRLTLLWPDFASTFSSLLAGIDLSRVRGEERVGEAVATTPRPPA